MFLGTSDTANKKFWVWWDFDRETETMTFTSMFYRIEGRKYSYISHKFQPNTRNLQTKAVFSRNKT